jgi:hypothetical protein
MIHKRLPDYRDTPASRQDFWQCWFAKKSVAVIRKGSPREEWREKSGAAILWRGVPRQGRAPHWLNN